MRLTARRLVLLSLCLGLAPTVGCTNNVMLGNLPGIGQQGTSKLKVLLGGDLKPLLSTQATVDQIDHIDLSVKVGVSPEVKQTIAVADVDAGATFADLNPGSATLKAVVFDAEGYIIGETTATATLKSGETTTTTLSVTLIPDYTHPTSTPSTMVTTINITNGATHANAGNVTTFAGTTPGYLDDTGTAAQFRTPSSIAYVPSYGFFVADSDTAGLRKITSAGVVTTVATGSYDNKPLGVIGGVCYDPTSTRLMFSDTANNRILFTYGYGGGPYYQSSVTDPRGLATDRAGHVYVVEGSNNRVRKYTNGGATLSFVADNPPAGFFDSPTGLAVDSAGNVYVSDTGHHRIVKITPAGTMATFAGTGTAGFADGAPGVAQFNRPMHLAIDHNGNLLVADAANHRIRRITRTGVVSTIAGQATPGMTDDNGGIAQFSSPTGVVVRENGEIYVADGGNSRIRAIK